jgi:hypothetical protein
MQHRVTACVAHLASVWATVTLDFQQQICIAVLHFTYFDNLHGVVETI